MEYGGFLTLTYSHLHHHWHFPTMVGFCHGGNMLGNHDCDWNEDCDDDSGGEGDGGGDDDQLHCSHVEFEDSEEEAGDTVVTGGLQLGQTGDQLVGQKRTKTKTKMPTDGLTSSISRCGNKWMQMQVTKNQSTLVPFLICFVLSFLRKTDHFSEDYKQVL